MRLSASRPSPSGENNEMIAIRKQYEAIGGKFIEHADAAEIFPGAWLSGPVARKYPERNWSGNKRIKTSEGLVEDTLPEDMSLVLDTERGLVVVSGCGHAGVVNTLEYARKTIRSTSIHAALGGFQVQDRARPNNHFWKALKQIANYLERSRNGHGDFSDGDSCAVEGFCRIACLPGRTHAKAGNDPNLLDPCSDRFLFQ